MIEIYLACALLAVIGFGCMLGENFWLGMFLLVVSIALYRSEIEPTLPPSNPADAYKYVQE